MPRIVMLPKISCRRCLDVSDLLIHGRRTLKQWKPRSGNGVLFKWICTSHSVGRVRVEGVLD